MKHHIALKIWADKLISLNKFKFQYWLIVHLALDRFGQTESGEIPNCEISILIPTNHKRVILRNGNAGRRSILIFVDRFHQLIIFDSHFKQNNAWLGCSHCQKLRWCSIYWGRKTNQFISDLKRLADVCNIHKSDVFGKELLVNDCFLENKVFMRLILHYHRHGSDHVDLWDCFCGLGFFGQWYWDRVILLFKQVTVIVIYLRLFQFLVLDVLDVEGERKGQHGKGLLFVEDGIKGEKLDLSFLHVINLMIMWAYIKWFVDIDRYWITSEELFAMLGFYLLD